MFIENSNIIKNTDYFFKIPNYLININILNNYIIPTFLFLSLRRNSIGIVEFNLKDISDIYFPNVDQRFKKYQEFYNSLIILNSTILNKSKILSDPSFSFSCFPDYFNKDNLENNILYKNDLIDEDFNYKFNKNILKEKIVAISLLTKEDLKYNFTMLSYKEYYYIIQIAEQKNINLIQFINFFVFIKKEITKNKIDLSEIEQSKTAKKLNMSLPTFKKYKNIMNEIYVEELNEQL